MAKNNVSLGSKLGISSNVLDVVKTELINTIYPVGAIYLSYNSTSPATLFGGSWTQIKDVFLLSAGNSYTAGSTGGSKTHTHTYGIRLGVYYGAVIGADNGAIKLQNFSSDGTSDWTNSHTWVSNNPRCNSALSSSATDRGGNVSETGAHVSYTSTLPPYLVVYAWRRTA